jgi:hypothetical protein
MWCLARPGWAAPDFTRSSIAVEPASPLEGTLATFTVVVRNSGDAEAGVVDARIEWPRMGFLAGHDAGDAAEIDHDARTLTVRFPLAAGAERRIRLQLLAPRESGGDALAMSVRLANYAAGIEHWVHQTATIDTRVSPAVRLGGFGITRAGIVTLIVLVAGVAFVGLVRLAVPRGASTGLIGPGRAAVAIVIAVGFWVLFARMAWRDYQSLTTWRETTCTVLGGRLSAAGTTRTRTSGGRTVDDTNYQPVLGLRYDVDGRPTYSSGFDTGSRLGIGGAGGRAEELTRYAVGAATPCWYDPADPADVVVLRGFGGAYLFALIPLPVFLVGVSWLRGLWRARSVPASPSRR